MSISPEDVKAVSNAQLQELGIVTNDELPTMDVIEELEPQTARDVARRALVLIYVLGLGFGAKPLKLKKALTDYSLWDYVTDAERALLNKKNLNEQDRINAQWLIEDVQALAWCLGLVELKPFEHYDDDIASQFPKLYTSPKEFILGATLRPYEEMYQQADFHYRLHWVAQNGVEESDDFHVSVSLIQERRRALEWVIGVDQDWDSVLVVDEE